MKYKYFIFSLVCFIFGGSLVFADSSNFEATINMEPEITENQINLVLGFRGEEVMAVSETITYDSSRITLLDIVAIDNFNLTLGEETIDGKWHTVKILADSMYSFTDTNYAVAVFEVKGNFKKGKTNDLFLYNVEAVGPEKSKYRYRGDLLTLTRESATEMYFKLEGINNGTKFNYFLKQYILIIVVIVLVIVGLIIFIILHLPSRRKEENRDSQIGDSIKSENYNNTKQEKIMINPDAVASIGETKKVINLEDAIVVSDLKPFESNPSKEDIEPKENTNNEEDINVPINAFNLKIEDVASTNVQEIPTEVVKSENTVASNTEPQTQIIDTSLPNTNKEVESQPIEMPATKNNDLKAPIYTVDIDNEDIETIEDDDLKTPPTNINGILILLITSMALLFTFNVYALEGDEEEYLIDELRECLVGNIPCSDNLDYNDDGKVDITDIVYTRNTINVNFENLMNTDPGFKEIHKFSPNINNEEVKKTSQAIVIKSTTKRTTRGKKTTKGQNATARTTTRKNTTERTTTGKETYNVNVTANNGLVTGDANKSVASGGSVSFSFNPNAGYTFASVNCTSGAKGTYSKSSNTLKVSSVKSNSTCTVNFAIRSDIQVSISGENGTYSPSSQIVSYGGTANFTIKPNNGFVIESASCNNGNYTINGNSLSVSNVTSDSMCTVKYKIKSYSVVVKDAVANRVLDTKNIPYNQKYEGNFQLNRDRVAIYVNGAKISSKKTKINDNTWSYSFSRKVTTDLVIELR